MNPFRGECRFINIFSIAFSRALKTLSLAKIWGKPTAVFAPIGEKCWRIIPWEKNSDDFVFDQQFIVQSVHFGFRLGDIPVPTRYEKVSSSINFRRSVVYGVSTLWTLVRWLFHRGKSCDALSSNHALNPLRDFCGGRWPSLIFAITPSLGWLGGVGNPLALVSRRPGRRHGAIHFALDEDG
jgi:hypothetical protein